MAPNAFLFWLPQDAGLLPILLLINAGLSWYNTFICFFDQTIVRQLYQGPNASQVTGLSARTFGGWTILSGFVRLYAAYNITNPPVYALAFWAYFAIVTHWTSELVIFRTTKFGVPTYINIAIDIGGLVWMFSQWNAYVGGG
ncbi:hypothetical protein G7Y89_g4631 [Cudoniella acicularis]|uniref:Ergosterol biosynthetic protein 28 n=1 Tax=Cudoniella acicularis TaxID=354080 RepID=A0A8H4RS33_9HELO|nr:hypothetical protein G7Y89_g4631 [Cudoniella acicularis]